MLPDAHVVHQTRGRLRVRIPSERRHAEYFAKLRSQFTELEGIQAIETNYVTGSLLLIHKLPVGAIEEHAIKNGLFRLRFSRPSPVPLSQRIAAQLSKLGTGVERVSRGTVDLPAVASIAFAAAAGFRMLNKRPVWPPVITLLWYAHSLLPNVPKAPAVPQTSRGSGSSYIQ
jgi:Heavy metal associated domain 2